MISSTDLAEAIRSSTTNGDSPDNISLNDGETVTCSFSNRLAAAGIPTLSPPALALLAMLMSLMVGWARQRGRSPSHPEFRE